MYTQRETIGLIKNQLALEYNCRAEDFDRKANVITERKYIDGCRRYVVDPRLFKMITFGSNCVIMISEKIKERIEPIILNTNVHRLFEYENIIKIDNEIRKYGEHISKSHHMYMPIMEVKDIMPTFEIKWYEQNDLSIFYNDERWNNALTMPQEQNEIDVLAVSAILDGEIVGLAGCSQDTPMLWQIGIDVLDGYRSRGIGATLVRLLKNEIIKRGKIPYYGTCSTNIYSSNIALKCGFIPAWVETESKPIDNQK